MTVPWAFQSSRSWESRSAADMVIIACISCYAVIRRHDQWRIFIIILNYADRWKSCVRVPTCDGWLNWTNDSPCSTARSSALPIRVRYVVSEGPSSQSADQCPCSPLPCTQLSRQHMMTARLIYVRPALIQTLAVILFFLALRIAAQSGGLYAHHCPLVFTPCDALECSQRACWLCHAHRQR